jgi:phage-related protein
MPNETRKPLFWVASSKKDFGAFPTDVHDVMGRALLDAQFGDMPRQAKPLKGFGGSGVVELVDSYDGDAYRLVYTVRFEGAVYVLHAFQKKSTKGIATPKREMDLVRSRLTMAEEHYRNRRK